MLGHSRLQSGHFLSQSGHSRSQVGSFSYKSGHSRTKSRRRSIVELALPSSRLPSFLSSSLYLPLPLFFPIHPPNELLDPLSQSQRHTSSPTDLLSLPLPPPSSSLPPVRSPPPYFSSRVLCCLLVAGRSGRPYSPSPQPPKPPTQHPRLNPRRRSIPPLDLDPHLPHLTQPSRAHLQEIRTQRRLDNSLPLER